jgi:hypothetical protein
MDTNCDMLRFPEHFVHTLHTRNTPQNAQKYGKAALVWARIVGGLNWYCIGLESVLTLHCEGA